MAGRVYTKSITKLKQDEYKKLHRLNFGPNNGSMQFELEMAKERAEKGKPDTDIVMIKEKDTVLAWALVFPEGRNRKRTAYFYTRAKLRRKGYGTRLMNKVQQIEPRPWVCPHDKPSGAFFRNYKNKIQNERSDFYLSSEFLDNN